MKLYAEYIAERTGAILIERPEGFATYRIDGEQCYIIDIFVQKEHRRKGVALDMCKEILGIAKGHGCRLIIGTVDPKTLGATDSLKAWLSLEMKLLTTENGLIYLLREI